jgi:hypothetical protein
MRLGQRGRVRGIEPKNSFPFKNCFLFFLEINKAYLDLF